MIDLSALLAGGGGPSARAWRGNEGGVPFERVLATLADLTDGPDVPASAHQPAPAPAPPSDDEDGAVRPGAPTVDVPPTGSGSTSDGLAEALAALLGALVIDRSAEQRDPRADSPGRSDAAAVDGAAAVTGGHAPGAADRLLPDEAGPSHGDDGHAPASGPASPEAGEAMAERSPATAVTEPVGGDAPTASPESPGTAPEVPEPPEAAEAGGVGEAESASPRPDSVDAPDDEAGATPATARAPSASRGAEADTDGGSGSNPDDAGAGADSGAERDGGAEDDAGHPADPADPPDDAGDVAHDPRSDTDARGPVDDASEAGEGAPMAQVAAAESAPGAGVRVGGGLLAAPTGTAVAARVVAALDQLRAAGPPQSVLLELPELGHRVRVSLRGARTVDVRFEGGGSAEGLEELSRVLEACVSGRGLILGDVDVGGGRAGGDRSARDETASRAGSHRAPVASGDAAPATDDRPGVLL